MDEVHRLILDLKDADPLVRVAAAKRLGKLRDASAVPALVEALGDEKASVRVQVSLSLWNIGRPAVPALNRVLVDESGWRRMMAAWTLNKIGDVSAVPSLLEALADEDEDVRGKAAEALGRIADVSSVPDLVDCLGDEVAHVREKAAEALGRIIEKAAEMEVLQGIENTLKDGYGSVSCKEREPDAMLESAKLWKRISDRRNELVARPDILLDDRPKPPKRGSIYRSMRRVSNG